MDHYDVIVLGGGVNGCGTARDLAMRGRSVLLLEKSDLACGASGANSGMIHGGIRYMLSDRHVTELACRDSGYIQRIAPHLLFRIPFLMPFTSRTEEATLVERATWYATEVYVGTYDQYQPLKRGKPSTRLSTEELYRLEPALRPGLAGAVTFDEWGIDSHRLCVLNALSAQRHGAQVRTWTEAREVIAEGGRAVGVRFRDALTGEMGEARAPAVYNATGAWSPAFARRNGARVPMRPGKGVHLTLDRRFSNYGITCTAVDGRQMFVMPHENDSIVGTTDDDYYGDPDDLKVTEDEVEYLLEGIEHAVPAIRSARILRAWAGIRTTLYEYGKLEDALSREHAIYDHASEGARNLFTMIGGKLASYRVQSQELTDLVARILGIDRPCRTHLEPLPGGESFPNVADLAAAFQMPEPTVGRMAYRHGANAVKICELAEADPALRAPLCRCEQVSYAEVVYSLRNENVRRLTDLRRRCRVGMGPCQGARCAGAAAALFARERDLSNAEAHRELLDFVGARFRGKRAVLGGEQMAQEELNRGNYLGVGNLDGSYRRE